MKHVFVGPWTPQAPGPFSYVRQLRTRHCYFAEAESRAVTRSPQGAWICTAARMPLTEVLPEKPGLLPPRSRKDITLRCQRLDTRVARVRLLERVSAYKQTKYPSKKEEETHE